MEIRRVTLEVLCDESVAEDLVEALRDVFFNFEYALWKSRLEVVVPDPDSPDTQNALAYLLDSEAGVETDAD